MTYGTFATYEEVATKFKIKFVESAFVQEREIVLKGEMFKFIQENLATRRNYANEYAICESIIFPILSVVAKHNNLPLWSHMRFDVAEAEGLCGIPDYLVAPAADIGTMFEKPVICVAEAKKDNFNEGWAQSLAEMIAAQRFNKDTQTEIFGIVTTGNFWQFGKLQHNILTMEIMAYSAIENMQKLFNTLNWIFYTATPPPNPLLLIGEGGQGGGVNSFKHRPVRSFVLREGRITAAQINAYKELWPVYGYDFIPHTIFNPTSIFATQQPLRLEIGFGNGESLAHMAIAQPECNFIGIEVHRPGVGHLFLTLKQGDLYNVRAIRHDAVEVINALPPACLEGCYILFPDPWPKTRHHKRRLIQPDFIATLAKTLQPGGFLHLATDWEEYAQWMLTVLTDCPDLRNSAVDGGYITRPAYRLLTRFEQRGQRLGHKTRDIMFYRPT